MKILLVNNLHYIKGGSERAYFDTGEILKEQGHEVAYFSTINKENEYCAYSSYFALDYDLKKKYNFFINIKIAFRIFYNFEAKRKIRKLIKDFKPDVAHLHNIDYHLSPSIISELKKQGVKTVMTLHDYRLICPNYNLFSNGKIWEKSKNGKYYKCIIDRCVDGSFMKSFLAALVAYFHGWIGVYGKIDNFISPSNFLINKFKEFDFKKEISYLPNPLINIPEVEEKNDENYILYFGRISKEKGVDKLVEVFSKLNSKIKLKIVGTGPKEKEIEKLIFSKGLKNIELLGYKQGSELWALIKNAKFIVVPSCWYENAPYSVIEAMGAGKAIICPRLGGLEELIVDGDTGFSYEADNFDELKDKIKYLLANPKRVQEVGEKARNRIKENNNKNDYYKQLVKIYNK